MSYDILKKEKEGNLQDRSRVPHHQPRRTPTQIEDKVIKVKCQTRYEERGSRLISNSRKASLFLRGQSGISSGETERELTSTFRHRVGKVRREFINWYAAKPFEIVQVDLKYIRDHKALSREQIIHLDRYNIPNYQWSALDVCSRF